MKKAGSESTREQGNKAPVEQVFDIFCEQLVVSPEEMRKTIDQVALNELADSIRAKGVIEKLLVRPTEIDEGDEKHAGFAGFEIVSGQRRWLASKIAGKTTCPCIVREMTDEEARELRILSNLQREDLPPMEEAKAFEQLLGVLGSVAAVAARVHKKQGYVAKRLKLCSLTENCRAALDAQLITIDHALLLARLGADEQDAALKWCLDRHAGAKKPVHKVIEEIVARRKERAEALAEDPEENGYYRHHVFEAETVVALKGHIAEDTGTILSRAPWSLDDTTLGTDVPACNACPQNTKANTPLFGDLMIGEATCTDGCCFKEKTRAFVAIRLSEVEASEGHEPLLVSWKATSTAPRMEKDGSGPNLTQIFKAGQWVEAKKKSCEHVRAAVTVDWSDAGQRGYRGREEKLRKPGEIIQVCVTPKCKAHAKAWEKAARANSAASPYKTEAEQKAEREKEAAARYAENQHRVAVGFRCIAKIKELPEQALRELLTDAVENADFDAEIVRKQLNPHLVRDLKSMPLGSEAFAQAVACLYLIVNYLSLDDWSLSPEDGRTQFEKALKMLGYTDKPAAKKAATKATKKGGRK